MVKLLALLATTAIVVGLWSGTLEVTFHQEKLSSIPGQIGALAQNSNVGGKSTYYYSHWKRQAEQAWTKDPKEKLALAITYTKEDSKNLNDQITGQKPYDQMAPQAKLLTESVRLLQQLKAAAPAEEILATRDSAGEAIRDASSVTSKLEDLAKNFRDSVKELAASTDELSGLLNVNQLLINTPGRVAGTEDKNMSTGK